MNKFLIKIFIVFTCVVIQSAELLAQCSMCKANAKTAGDNGSNIASGLNSGIKYLLIVPYLAIGIVAVLFIINYRKKQMQDNA